MYVQEVAYAVSCAVQVAFALVPQEHPRKYVELCASCAFREDGVRYCDMAFHYKGKVVALFIGWLADGYGAGYIGRTVEVLCAGVNQQQVAFFYLCIGLGCRRVMYHRPMCAVSGYGVKRVVEIQGLFAAVSGQDFGHAHFSQRLAVFHHRADFHERTNHGHTVAHHGIAYAVNLYIVLYGFQHRGRRLSYHGTVAERAFKQRSGLGCAYQHACVFRKRPKEVHGGIVGSHGHIVGLQIRKHTVCQLVTVDEYCRVVLRQVQECCGHRVAGYVAGADVEYPCYLVECGYECA